MPPPQNQAPPFGRMGGVLAAGVLPGLIQTPFRAEVQGVLVALQLAARVTSQIRVWSDCKGVVDRVSRFVQGVQASLSLSAPNSDLWCQFPDLLHSFWDLWNEARRAYAYEELIAQSVQKVHLEVALAARQLKKYASTGYEPGTQVDVLLPMQVPVADDDACRKIFRKYGRPYVVTLLAWLRLTADSPAVQHHEPAWYSFVQLYIAFVTMTGVRPPVYREASKTWYSAQASKILSLREIPLSKRITWFQKQLVDILRAVTGHLDCRQVRPSSEMLQVRLSSVWLRWGRDANAVAEQRLFTELGRACTRHDDRWKRLHV